MVSLVSTTRSGPEPTLEKPIELGRVKTWSFSTLSVYEECAYRLFIAKVKKIQEESGPAADRGTMIHTAAEDFVQGKTDDIIPELAGHEKGLAELKVLYDLGQVSVEGEWAFTIDWEKTGWMDANCWARIKLDVFVQMTPTYGRVIDYKSGKKFGNEIKHQQQGLLYAIGAFMRDPNLAEVDVEFWYTDLPLKDTTKKHYTRQQALMFLPGFHKRGVKMTTETEFDPNPSKMNCKWCAFKKGEFPECKWGVM